MTRLIRLPLVFCCCAFAALSIGCAAETDETPENIWYDEGRSVCLTEAPDGVIIETPCPTLIQGAYYTQGYTPGGCADSKVCTDPD